MATNALGNGSPAPVQTGLGGNVVGGKVGDAAPASGSVRRPSLGDHFVVVSPSQRPRAPLFDPLSPPPSLGAAGRRNAVSVRDGKGPSRPPGPPAFFSKDGLFETMTGKSLSTAQCNGINEMLKNCLGITTPDALKSYSEATPRALLGTISEGMRTSMGLTEAALPDVLGNESLALMWLMKIAHLSSLKALDPIPSAPLAPMALRASIEVHLKQPLVRDSLKRANEIGIIAKVGIGKISSLLELSNMIARTRQVNGNIKSLCMPGFVAGVAAAGIDLRDPKATAALLGLGYQGSAAVPTRTRGLLEQGLTPEGRPLREEEYVGMSVLITRPCPEPAAVLKIPMCAFVKTQVDTELKNLLDLKKQLESLLVSDAAGLGPSLDTAIKAMEQTLEMIELKDLAPPFVGDGYTNSSMMPRALYDKCVMEWGVPYGKAIEAQNTVVHHIYGLKEGCDPQLLAVAFNNIVYRANEKSFAHWKDVSRTLGHIFPGEQAGKGIRGEAKLLQELLGKMSMIKSGSSPPEVLTVVDQRDPLWLAGILRANPVAP